jgi:tetratricopeptide (TPR) repeat protein
MPAQSPPAGTSPLKRIPVGRADWLRLVGGAILAAGAVAVYSRTFSVPLLFDDHPAIVGNSTIRHWSTAFGPPINTTASGRPILNLSLAINYAISGTAVWSYHAANLAIHVLAGLTLFGIVRRTLRLRSGQALVAAGQGRRAPPLDEGAAAGSDAASSSDATLLALAVALLWTLHPLQTESVTYLVQRAESLMGLFYLLTLYGFIRGAEADGHPRRRWFALSVAACLLGMATKEVMVSAPLIVLLYDRTFVSGSWREAWRRRWGLHVALAATWLPLVWLVAGTGWDRSNSAGLDVGITPWAYWLTQFEAVTRYLWLSVWPHPLVFEYGTFWVNLSTGVALYALVVVVLAVAVLVALWRWPAWGFLGAWFFAILAPTSLVPGAVQMIVEHRMYLPLAAVTTLAAMGIHAAVGRRSWVVLAALALGLGLLAARRNEDYRNVLTIWSDTVAKRPNNERAHNNLGLAWSEIPGRLPDAIAEYETALRLKPDYAGAHDNLGVAWSKMPGRLNDAIAQLEEALRLQPDDADTHTNLGNAWSQMPGRLNDAAAQYEEALRLKPDSAEAHNNLGLVWARMPGRLNEAAAQYEEALRLQPDFAEAHNNLGVAWSKMPGRLNDAIAQYEEALRLLPDFAEAHNNLGLAWAKMPGRLPDAAAQYEEALRLQPDYAQAHNNLGLAWAKMPGRLNDAIAQFEEALRLQPDFAQAHYNLGVALSQMPGRLNDAAAQYEEALRLQPDIVP